MVSQALVKKPFAVLSIVSLVFLVGCGGGNNQLPPPSGSKPTPTITTISPNSVMADATTGVLTSRGTKGAGEEPDSVVVHPSGKFAYVANFGDELLGSVPGSVSMCTINADGGLTSTGTIAEALVGTISVAVHPSGKFAYVANRGNSNTISMYTIDAITGALTSTGTIAAGTLPESMAVIRPASLPMWRIKGLTTSRCIPSTSPPGP